MASTTRIAPDLANLCELVKNAEVLCADQWRTFVEIIGGDESLQH